MVRTMYPVNKIVTNHPAYRPKQGSPCVLLIICLLTTGLFNLAAVTTTANATDYYLADPKGADGIAGTSDDVDSSDSYPGTSEALPWKTLTKAANTAQSGDTVLVKAGIYTETLRPANSGTAGALITFKAHPGENAVIDGQGSIANGVDFSYSGGRDYIRFEGFEVKGWGLNGIYLGGGVEGIEIVACNIHDNRANGMSCGMTGNPATNITISDNRIHNNWDDAIKPVVERSIIAKNIIGPSGNPHNDPHSDGIQIEHMANTVIKNNVFRGYGQLIYISLYEPVGYFENVDIYGNVFYTTDEYRLGPGSNPNDPSSWWTAPCIFLWYNPKLPGRYANNINIHSNTFLWTGLPGILIYKTSSSHPVTNITIRNNIFFDSDLIIQGVASEEVSSDYNLYFDSPDFGSATPWINEGSHSIVGQDPKFINYTRFVTWDVHLEATSPAIDAGDPALASVFNLQSPLDIDDNSRPQDGDGNGSFLFDIGAYEYVSSDPNDQQHTLEISSTSGGRVTNPGEGPFSYNHGSDVLIEAAADLNCQFVNWTGTAVNADKVDDPNNAITKVTMDSNYTLRANFVIEPHQHTLEVSSTNGGTVTNPGEGQFSYNHGSDITIEANADLNYRFVNWTGTAVNAGKVDSPSNASTKVTVDANYTIQANFSINTYTITSSAGSNGQINPDGITQVNSGGSQAYTITADPGYKIFDVLVDGSSVGAVTGYNFTNVTANRTITASFAIDEIDVIAPTVTNLSPQADSIQAPLNTLITLDITDSGDGVDAKSVTIKVNNDTVYSGNTDKFSSAYGECCRWGTKANYKYVYQSNERFNFDQIITVTTNATDLAGNSMDEYSYSFQTKMRSFGKNKKVNKDNNLSTESAEFASIVNNNRPKTCCDSKGNIWATWHAGSKVNRDIYIGKLITGEEEFGDSKNLTDNITDQCNPAMAVGSDDKLYVAWQDNRRGNWDIYLSTSSDGINWSTEIRVTDSNDNQINPALVVGSSNNACIVWEDDRNGNKDIYVATSSNGFVTKTISQITLENSNQVEPAIAVDSDNTVYVVWTDTRNNKNDIYGAASNNGPWTNIPIVNTEDSQSSPAIATEDVGSILHIVWVDDRPGDDDIYYAKTGSGLPGSPLIGSSIIDDTTGADQLRPAIAVSGSTGNNLKVFVSWEDERNTDYDLYFTELGSGSGTNVFVDDDGTNTGQAEPAINLDKDGYPYLVWTDNRNSNKDIYYAGSTFIESTALASGYISTSSTTIVQTAIGVSVAVPAGAYPCDIKITISEVKNPPKTSKEYLSLPYDFGPSGIEFDSPVTITIPYDEVTSSGYSASAYWYNLLTAAPSQQGITDIETIFISSIPYLRFKTTHFTQFFVGGSFGSSNVSVSGGGGGGGCSMYRNSQASALELLLPYIGLTVTMVILKLKDRRKSKTRNII